MPVMRRPQCSLPHSWRSECSTLQVSSVLMCSVIHHDCMHTPDTKGVVLYMQWCVGSGANVAQSHCERYFLIICFSSPTPATYLPTYLSSSISSPSLLSRGSLPPPVCDECRVIGIVSSLSLPVWGTDCNPCLMDYVPLVHRGLQDKVHACALYSAGCDSR